MSVTDPTWLLIIAGVSVLCNLGVIIALLRQSRVALCTQYVFYLSVVVLVSDFLSLPDLFSDSETGCEIATGLRQYLQLASMFICLLMAILAYHMVFIISSAWLKDWRVYGGIAICCAVAFAPLGVDGYGNVAGFCTFDSTPDGRLWLKIIFSIEFAISMISMIVFLLILIGVSGSDRRLTYAVFKGVGSYAIVTIVCFIPKGIELTDRDLSAVLVLARSCSYVASIAYALIFAFQKKRLYMFERQQMLNPWSESNPAKLIEEFGDSAARFDSEYSACDSLLEASSIVTL